MKIGFLFPGQGAQYIGMGKDLYNNYEIVKKTYKKIENITGANISKITFEGTEDELNQTKNTQICILSMSLAILELLKENNIKAEISAGLSLGEYTSLIYSKAISFEDGIKLVMNRGKYMQEYVPDGDWSMAAVIGLEEKQIEDVCSNVKNGFVKPVNFNCPGQIVISGEKTGVEEAAEIAKEFGAKKVRILKTSGPFHTEKLRKASEELRKDLDSIEIHSFETKVVKNIDGELYSEKDNVKEILANHVINPVRFSNCLEMMLENGVDTFVEIGPGKTLSGFVKRLNTNKEIKTLNIDNMESLDNVIKLIKEGEKSNG